VLEYGILQHGMMLGDARRLRAYADALRQVVRPGDVVVDIGSGTGVFAMVACRVGARRVYAIEPGHVIHAGRAVVAANGLADRITFVAARSTDVVLPERADVVVLDVRGVLPDEQLAIAADARRRLLAPGGTIVPRLDTVWAAPVTAPDVYHRHVGAWRTDGEGIDLRAVGAAMANARYKCRVQPDQLLAAPQVAWQCDYGADEDAAEHAAGDAAIRRADLRWALPRGGVAHGIVAWFDTVLAPGAGCSNRPGEPPLLYGHAYFPWPEPVALAEGADLRVVLSARPDGETYRWDWTTSVQAAPTDTPTTFVQSTIIG
jgi:protein arginine N-methyltransferase 1